MGVRTFTLALALGMAGAAVAQPALPFNINFEEPNYSLTFNGNGVIYAGATTGGQDFWTGGGAWFIQNDQPYQGAQSVVFRNSVAFPITGTTFNAFRDYTPASTGIMVAQCYMKIVDDPGGRSAFSLEMFANNGANRMVSVGMNDAGEAYLRPRSNFPGLPAANAPFAVGEWHHVMAIFDIDRNLGYGFVGRQPLLDTFGSPLFFNITDLTAFAFNDVTLGGAIAGNNRLAYGVPTAEPRGTDSVAVDNLRVENYLNAGTVEIAVNFGDYFADITTQTVSMEIRDASNGTVLDSFAALPIGLDGTTEVLTSARGMVDISVKGTHWLRKTFTDVSLTDTGVFHLMFDLVNGDVDGDNEVGPGDFSLLANAFLSVAGDPNWNPEADLDGDGEVGPGDFSILANNFLSAGDE